MKRGVTRKGELNKLEIMMRQNGPRGDNKLELLMDVWIPKCD